jgi:hypothetical protein
MKRMILLFSRDIYCIYATTEFNLTKHISEETPNRWKIHKKKQFPLPLPPEARLESPGEAKPERIHVL